MPKQKTHRGAAKRFKVSATGKVLRHHSETSHIFTKKTTREGAICGMIAGIVFTAVYIINVKFLGGSSWFCGVIPEAIGGIGMLLNFIVAIVVSKFTKEPPAEVQEIVENVRVPKGAGEATAH